MSDNRCTRCGKEGHRASQCPWPAEAGDARAHLHPSKPSRDTKPRLTTYNPDVPRIGPGVYCLEDIRQRCRIDAITGCWSWSMAVSDGGKPHSSITPRVSLPRGVLSVEHRTVSVSRVAWLMAGKRLLSGWVVWRTCGNELCVSPAHLKAGTKAEEGAWMRQSKHRQGDPRRAAINRRNVAASQAIPADAVHTIASRLSAGELQREVSKDTGIHVATISKIARGKHLHQRGGGLVRGASVFALAEASA